MQGYTRRQLKEDKFAETAQGAALWATGHRRIVVWTIGVVLAAILLTAGIIAWRNHETDAANTALGAALRIFDAPLRPPGTPAPEGSTEPSFTSIAERGKAAEKEFKAIADKYSWVRPGKIARYLRGVALIQAGDTAAADQELKAVASSSDKDVAALAKMSLASMDRGANRYSDAINIYKDLAEHPTNTVSKIQAQFELAEVYEKIDPQQATSLYQQLQKDNPQSPAAQLAGQKLNKPK